MADAGEGAGATPSRRRWVGIVQIAVVAALILLALFYARRPGAGDAPALAAEPAPAPLVRVVRPQAANAALRIAATGSVNVRNHVALAPQVGGRVVSIAETLRAGGAFAAGERLLLIDRRDYALANDQAKADIAVAEANLRLQQAQGEAARANYALLHPGKEVPPLVAKAPQIAQAKAQLEAARARAAVAALELERTAFALPFAGRVTASSAEIGQLLARGQAFGQAFALDAVEVVAPLPPDDLLRLQPAAGRAATVRSRNQTFAARVERVSAELDARSRFATLYLSFQTGQIRQPGQTDAAEAPPRPGTFVDVEIEGPVHANAFRLPEAAEQVGGRVWVVANGALASVAPAVLGRTPQGWIVTAFDAKDGVVVGAVPGAREGLAVKVQDAERES